MYKLYPMSDKRLIYALKCPFTSEVHYIGKTTKGMLRPFRHMKESHSEKVSQWIEELKKLGYRPEVEVLRYVSEVENLDDLESFYIKTYYEKGNALLNSNLIKPLAIIPNLEQADPTGMKSIGEFVKERRKRIGISQEEFADTAGIGLRFLRELEQNAKEGFSTKTVNQLLSMFGCRLGVEKIPRE